MDFNTSPITINCPWALYDNFALYGRKMFFSFSVLLLLLILAAMGLMKHSFTEMEKISFYFSLGSSRSRIIYGCLCCGALHLRTLPHFIRQLRNILRPTALVTISTYVSGSFQSRNRWQPVCWEGTTIALSSFMFLRFLSFFNGSTRTSHFLPTVRYILKVPASYLGGKV